MSTLVRSQINIGIGSLTNPYVVDNDFHRSNAVFDLFKDLVVKDLDVEVTGKPVEANGAAESNGTEIKN